MAKVAKSSGEAVNAIREKLIHDLQIVPENIKGEAIRQPLLFIEAVRYRVDKMRAQSRAKAELKTWSAQQWLKVKKEFEGTRITNDEIRSYLEKDPECQELSAKLDEADAREEFAKLLLEAYRMRRDGVRILADAEGYEASKATADAMADNVNRSISSEARRLYKHRGSMRDPE